VFGEVGPCLPVILIEGVLDRNNGILLHIAEVEVGKFGTSDPLARVGVGVLEIQVVFSILEELGGRDIKCNLDFTFISSLLDGLRKEFQRFVGTGYVWGESSLITDIDG